MKVQVQPGKYVMAVSGGVDSMVLLDILSKNLELELVVAHFNHGIREEAASEEIFVRQKIKQYGLKFAVGYGHLGKDASEEAARNARYRFLEDVKQKYKAAAIITAHHQDDLIETAIINILRGTGRRGLVAIQLNKNILRPLIMTPKAEILDYAKQHDLEWISDKSNDDTTYLRNRLRHQVLNNLRLPQRQKILKSIEKIEQKHQETEDVIANLLQKIEIDSNSISRQSFIFMPTDVATEVLLAWLKRQGLNFIDKATISRLSVVIKTAKPNTRHEIAKGYYLKIGRSSAHFSNTL